MNLPTTFLLPPEASYDAQVIMNGEYDVQLARPPATILDLGANVGLFTFWAAHHWAGSRITAFEPWPENYRDLVANLKDCRNIALYQVAVGETTGEVKIHRGRNRMCCSFMQENQLGPAADVPLIAASSLTSHEFVKLDVEGHEMTILSGLDLSATRAVVIEAHTDQLAQAVTAFLLQRDFVSLERRPSVNGCTLLKFIRQGEELIPLPTPPEAAPFKLFLGLPVYGAYNAHFVHSLLALATHRPCEIVIRPCVGDSLVARARNRLCAQFLASDCTHMLQLDTDLIFSPEHIARLITHAQRGLDIVAGLYPKKQKELGWVCNVLDAAEPEREDGLQRVKYAGTGCLMVSRAVLLTMINAHPEIEYDPDEGDESGVKWDFFATGVRAFPADAANGSADTPVRLCDLKPSRRRYLSEDWMFCQRALDLGFDIWMDTSVILKHVGEMIYPLQDLESFAVPNKELSR